MIEIQHICSIRKIGLLLTILTAISAVPFSSSLEISISAPDGIEINESFHVDVTSAISESVGIKVFINRSLDAKAMSEILVGEEWKKQYASAPYYFQYPADNSFTLRAFDTDDSATLCVFLQTSPISKSCVPIKISALAPSSISEDKVPQEKDSGDEQEQENVEDEEIHRYTPETEDSSAEEDSSASTTISVDSYSSPKQPIMLNSKPSGSHTVYTTEAKVRIAMNYALALACILLLFLVCKRRV